MFRAEVQSSVLGCELKARLLTGLKARGLHRKLRGPRAALWGQQAAPAAVHEGSGHRGRAPERESKREGETTKHLHLVNVYTMQLFCCLLLKLELIKSSHRIFLLFYYWHCRITTLRRT